MSSTPEYNLRPGASTPLGVANDPAKVELFQRYRENHSYDEIYSLWADIHVTNPTVRQLAVETLTEPYGVGESVPEGTILRLVHQTETEEGEIASLRDRLAHRPDLAAELAQGILFWLERTDEQQVSRDNVSYPYYQQAILSLLPLADENNASRLLSHYLLKDNDYSPTTRLLMDSAVDSKIKYYALTNWILDAQQQEIAQRPVYGTALDQMIQFIREAVLDNQQNPDTAIFNTLVSYIEGHYQGKSYTPNQLVSRVAELLEDPELKFTFALRHIFLNTDFVISNDVDYALFRWTFQACADRGIVIDERANELEDQYQLLKRQLMARKAAEKTILWQLRQP